MSSPPIILHAVSNEIFRLTRSQRRRLLRPVSTVAVGSGLNDSHLAARGIITDRCATRNGKRLACHFGGQSKTAAGNQAQLVTASGSLAISAVDSTRKRAACGYEHFYGESKVALFAQRSVIVRLRLAPVFPRYSLVVLRLRVVPSLAFRASMTIRAHASASDAAL